MLTSYLILASYFPGYGMRLPAKRHIHPNIVFSLLAAPMQWKYAAGSVLTTPPSRGSSQQLQGRLY